MVVELVCGFNGRFIGNSGVVVVVVVVVVVSSMPMKMKSEVTSRLRYTQVSQSAQSWMDYMENRW